MSRNKIRKANRQDLKESFIEVLKQRRGIVLIACREIGINPITFYRWQNSDPDFYKRTEEIRDAEIGTIAEDQMCRAIINGDMNMVRFYLQARNRKYAQRQQIEGKIEIETKVNPLEEKYQKIKQELENKLEQEINQTFE